MQNAECGGLRLDKERGSMAIVTDGTCGGFAESGRIEAGPLSFEILGRDDPAPQDAPGANHSSLRCGDSVATTLWVSSLDGAPIGRSSRLLLVHLTDVQGEGAQFADDRRRILLRWGQAPLIAVAAAEVTLRLASLNRKATLKSEAALKGEGGVAVFALDTAGNRIAEVPVAYDTATGALRFTVSTRGPDGRGRIYYEIAR
jgi:hypothetical protein